MMATTAAEAGGGETGAPGGDGIAHVNGQVAAEAAAVEEEEEEGAAAAMTTARPTATGGLSRTATVKMTTGAPHPALGG